MSLRAEITAALEQGALEEVDALVAEQPRGLRHLLGLSYRSEEEIRGRAARAIAAAGRHHPRLVKNLVRRLVWAMNDESGTHAVTAPKVIEAIAEERPELLLPMVPDLVRLAGDSGLHEGLSRALQLVVAHCPGKVGTQLQEELNKQIAKGGCCER